MALIIQTQAGLVLPRDRIEKFPFDMKKLAAMLNVAASKRGMVVKVKNGDMHVVLPQSDSIKFEPPFVLSIDDSVSVNKPAMLVKIKEIFDEAYASVIFKDTPDDVLMGLIRVFIEIK